MRAQANAHSERLSSQHFVITQACVHASARCDGCVSGSEDGSDSCNSFVGESNARAVQLVAQLAHANARKQVRQCQNYAKTLLAMTGTGH